MWLKKVKQKKLQFILTALVLMSISAILTACLSFVSEVNQYANSFYGEEKCPELFAIISGEGIKDKIRAESQVNSKITQLYVGEGVMYNKSIRLEDSKETLSIFMLHFMSMKDFNEIPWFFELKHTDERNPKPGTVWIAELFAENHDIKVGDKLVVDEEKNISFVVEDLYRTAICPDSTISYQPFYINTEDLKKLEGENSSAASLVSFKRKSQEDSLEDFINELPEDVRSNIMVKFDRDALISSLSMLTMMLGGVGMAASVIIFIVSIIIIRFIIKSNLTREYKSIGIYKSIGFKNKTIIGFYLKAYGLIGGVGIMAGVSAGIPLSVIMGNMMTKYLDKFQMTSITVTVAVGTTIGLILLLLVNIYGALLKVKKINPVMALKMEMTSSKSKLKKSLIKNAQSPVSMAINDIFKKKASSLMIVLILAVAFYLSIFSAVMYDTTDTMQDYVNTWFGIPQSDCYIDYKMTEEIKEKIKNSEYVASTTFGQLIYFASINADQDKNGASELTVFPYSSFDRELTGISYTQGREPKNEDEIAVSELQLSVFQRKVGEYITFEINKVKREYLICGVYQSMMNGGISVQMLTSSLNAHGQTIAEDVAVIKLKDTGKYEEFQKEMSELIPEGKVTKYLKIFSDSIVSIASIVKPICLMLVAIFISFSFLNIINVLLVNNIENRRKFGILKALGFTNNYIILQNIVRITLLSFVSIFIACVIHFSISRQFFDAMIGVDGLINRIPLIAVLVSAIFLLILFTALMFGLPLRKINPTNLMEE